MKQFLVCAVAVFVVAGFGMAKAHAGACAANQNPLSQETNDYGISLSREVGKFKVHWWGRLVCGTFDSLVPLAAQKVFPGITFPAGGKLFPVQVNKQQIIQNWGPKTTLLTTNCEGDAQDTSIIHCKLEQVDDINQHASGAYLQKLNASQEFFVFMTPKKGNVASRADFYESSGVSLSSMDEQGKTFDADENGVFEPKVLATPPIDSDSDGVEDAKDKCPNTPAGTQVDANGCSVAQPQVVDADGDGVDDSKDDCAGTAAGTQVDELGCPLVAGPAPAEGETRTEGSGGSSCALMPMAGPNAGMLMLLAAVVPLIARRKR